MDSDDETETVRQRRRRSDPKIPYREAAQGRHLVFPSFPRVWRSRILSLLYWMFVIYIVWVCITHLVAYMYRSAMATIAPFCSVPFLGPRLPFCPVFPPEGPAFDVSTVATTQDGLIVVLDQVGVNFDLARDMVDHEFAVRDLRIRVAAGELSRRKELTQELESLIRYTKQAAKDLSKFTAKVSKSIDTVKIFDEYAVKTLEGIAENQRNPPTLSSRLKSALSPVSAFSVAVTDEEQVKKVFIDTATRISGKVKLLLDEAFYLGHNLDSIQETLERIGELSIDEVGDLPQMHVLGALWSRLARPDDHAQHQSHTSLLTDLSEFYTKSSNVMKETIGALNHIEAELGEFRDDYATPGLILKDEPLEIVLALLRQSGQRLETGRNRLQYIEDGGRPQQKKQLDASPRTATLIRP